MSAVVLVKYVVILLSIFICKVQCGWKLSSYGDKLNVHCGPHSKVVVHDAHFGFFDTTTFETTGNHSLTDDQFDCWTDVSTFISNLCSGLSSCETNVHYSIGLSQTALIRKCLLADSLKPSLFVKYDCISDTLFTKISPESHVDVERVGGYLSTIDYADSLHGGTEWRSHLAEALCNAEHPHLPMQFFLPAPKPKYQTDAVAFVIRLKDINLTPPAGKTQSSGPHRDRYVLSTKLDCLKPEKPCHQDYLEISAKLPKISRASGKIGGSGDGGETDTEPLLPIARFCLVNASASASVESDVAQKSAAEGETDDVFNGELVFGHGSSPDRRVFGPLPPAVGLQFTSNLNLLNTDPNLLPGKGILLEYIALFCTPINVPTGNGSVEYRFKSDAHSTVAYAEISCPPNSWLEPQKPPELDYESSIPAGTAQSAWWLQRKRVATHICDHHQRFWEPYPIPTACLTESELSAFVANVEMLRRKPLVTPKPMPTVHPVDFGPQNRTGADSAVWYAATSVPGSDLSALIAPSMESVNENRLHTGTSVAISAVLGFIVCVLVVLLIVCSLRHKFGAQYNKTVSFPSMPDRLTRSSSVFNPSMHSVYPTINSVEWCRKLGRSRWDLFKPWRTHTWSQNLSGTYPDLPRQTVSHGTVFTGQKSPETVILRGDSMPFRRVPQHPSGQSSFSLVPGTPQTQPLDSPQPIINGSPWLRTTSTTQLTQQPATYMNSSGEVFNPLDAYPFNHPWWQPWRRSLKKQRRLYMHLQRRREAEYQSQRRLMESGVISNGSSSQICLPASNSGLVHSNSRESNSLVDPRNLVVPNPDRPLSQRTTGSSRTFTTSDGGTITPGGVENGVKSAQATQQLTNHQPRFAYTNWDLNDGIPPQSICAQPYQEVQPIVDRPPSVAGDTLPWKSTPTAASKSFSNGLRRFSSFLRNLNGSLTPPRSATRRSHSQLINQLHPHSMSTLDSTNYFQGGPLTDAANQNSAALGRITCFPFTPNHTGFSRAKSESGSVRLGRSAAGLRSLFNIPIPRDSGNTYNLDVDDSTNGDPMSASTETPTKTSVIYRPPSGSKPDEWAQFSDWASATTVTPDRSQISIMTHLYSPWSTGAPHVYPTRAVPPIPTTQSNPTHYPVPQPSSNPHYNDPYLEPLSVKRLRVESTTGGAGAKPSHSSDSDRQPSATSSAISSLVFADSVVDGDLEPDSYSTSQRTVPACPAPTVTSSSNGRPSNNSPMISTAGTSRGLDYVTYDLTRSGTVGGLTASNIPNSTGLKRPSGLEGELLATQLETNAIQAGEPPGPYRRPKRNINQSGNGSSRPSSDAMISNHYYDANEFGFVYPDSSTPVAPIPPPRVDLILPRLAPPIQATFWNSTSIAGSGRGQLRPDTTSFAQPNRRFGPIARGEFGSMDSLYETVDQYPGQQNADAILQPDRGNQLTVPTPSVNSGQSSNPASPWPSQDTLLQRQRMALPPTPDSPEFMRAPMATGDEVSDTE